MTPRPSVVVIYTPLGEPVDAITTRTHTGARWQAWRRHKTVPTRLFGVRDRDRPTLRPGQTRVTV